MNQQASRKYARAFVLSNMTNKKLFTRELRPIILSIRDLKLKKISKQRSVVRDIHVCFLHVNNVVILFSLPLL